MKQHEAVIEAIRQMGGYATLAQLYHAAVRVPACEWKTKTPFASIRRIVQTTPEFFRIRPGLWALVSERARVLEDRMAFFMVADRVRCAEYENKISYTAFSDLRHRCDVQFLDYETLSELHSDLSRAKKLQKRLGL